MGNYFYELSWKIIRANNLLQFIHQVTIEFSFRSLNILEHKQIIDNNACIKKNTLTQHTPTYICNKSPFHSSIKCYGSENTNFSEFKQVKGGFLHFGGFSDETRRDPYKSVI